jgi:hypothetical protein
VKTIEAGLLTCGSPYSPTPSQPPDGQWLIQLAFVPAYSGASVRDLHPLPESMPSIANVRYQTQNYHLKQHMSSTVLPHQDGMSGGRDMAVSSTSGSHMTALLAGGTGEAAMWDVSGPRR